MRRMLVLILLLTPNVSADVIVDDGSDPLPPSTGFTADCPTWTAGDITWMSFWARNDNQEENARALTLVHGVTYVIDVALLNDFDSGWCITVHDNAAGGGFTRTSYLDSNYPSWNGPLIPKNSGFYVNGPGPAYMNWRTDDREGYYDTGYSGFRYFERLDPGIFYGEDIARWLIENHSSLTSIVTVAP